MAQNLGFDFDPEEVTKTDNYPLGDDPLMNQGKLMAAVVRLDKQMKEGFNQVRDLNGRLSRIEKLLYGAAGSALIGAAQIIYNLFLHHGP
jgi:hypothetical protein